MNPRRGHNLLGGHSIPTLAPEGTGPGGSGSFPQTPPLAVPGGHDEFAGPQPGRDTVTAGRRRRFREGSAGPARAGGGRRGSCLAHAGVSLAIRAPREMQTISRRAHATRNTGRVGYLDNITGGEYRKISFEGENTQNKP